MLATRLLVLAAVIAGGIGSAVLLERVGAEARRGYVRPTPPPPKVVAAKVEREHLVDPTSYWLVAEDETVCRVRMPVFAITKVGDSVPCEWRTW